MKKDYWILFEEQHPWYKMQLSNFYLFEDFNRNYNLFSDFKEASDAFMKKVLGFDFDKVIETILSKCREEHIDATEAIWDMNVFDEDNSGGWGPPLEIEDSWSCETSCKPRRRNRQTGKLIGQPEDFWTFTLKDSRYLYEITENCFLMDDPYRDYAFSIEYLSDKEDETGEYNYMELVHVDE